MSSSSSAVPSSSSSKGKQLVVSVQEASNVPLLVSFPQGVPSIDLSELPVLLSRSMQSRPLRTKVQIPLDSINFEGNDYGENSSKRNCYGYAVGVIRKNSTKFELYPCNHPYILRAQQKHAAVSPRATMSNAERKESLATEFGSKKRKKALSAAKSNTISVDNISGAQELESLLTTQSSEVAQALIEQAEHVISTSKKRSRVSGPK